MIIIGTYHKTGTFLFREIWKTINKLLKLKINYKFLLNFYMATDEEIKNNKCIILIRNPYEIICSGYRYHKIANETWLNKKPIQKCFIFENKDYGEDKSYKDVINSFENEDDKIMFELRNAAYNTIYNIYNDIKNRNFNNNILIIKIEDLYNRNNIGTICKKIINHIGLNRRLDKFIKGFNKNLNKNFHRTNNKNTYTYPKLFKKHHYEEFNKLYPDDILDIMDYK